MLHAHHSRTHDEVPPVLEPCPTPAKVRLANEAHALRHARQKAQELLAAGTRVKPMFGYLCPCGAWHLTSRDYEPAGRRDNVLIYQIADHLQDFYLEGRAGA